jgi:hypothetical protein
MDVLALCGVLAGTAGAGISVHREYLAKRRNLAVGLGAHFNTSRIDPVGEITHGWACIASWNKGGRPLAIERAEFQVRVGATAVRDGAVEPRQVRAQILLGSPIEMAVDSPTQKIYTPLGPMLAAGINPFSPIHAVVTTTGGRKWLSPAIPLIQSIPPNISPAQLKAGLERLRMNTDRPPVLGDEIALKREEPFLPETSARESST